MSTRALSMQRRRERILVAARAIISVQGFEGLSTRNLAAAAGVTPPTLYNLIGNKDAIIAALNLETAAAIEARLAPLTGAPAIEQIDAIVDQSVELFASDEAYYRAGLLASGEVGESCEPTEVNARAVQIAEHACEQARDQGHLRGRLSVHFIAQQMYRSWRVPFDDWARGWIDLATCRRQALQGIYCALAPDAVETFGAELLKRLRALEREANSSKIQTERSHEA